MIAEPVALRGASMVPRILVAFFVIPTQRILRKAQMPLRRTSVSSSSFQKSGEMSLLPAFGPGLGFGVQGFGFAA